MRLACSTFPFQGLPLTGALTRIHELGFRFADLVMSHDPRWGHLEPHQVLHDPLPVLEQLEEAEGRSGVKLAAFSVGLEVGSLSERGQFDAVCKLARRMRVPVLTVHAGTGDELVEYRRLRDFHALATECGLTLCVETYTPSIFQEPKLAAELLDGLRGVRLTLDTGHLLSQGFLADTWGPLYRHTGHVHVWDAERAPENPQVPYGRGLLDLPALVAGLRAANFAETLTVEYFGVVTGVRTPFDSEPEIVKVREALEAAAPELAGA